MMTRPYLDLFYGKVKLGRICVWMGKTFIKSLIVLNMQQMVKVIKPFCWDQNFVHIGLSAPALGLYTHEKTLKMCTKSEFKSIFAKLATNDPNDKAFLLTLKF